MNQEADKAALGDIEQLRQLILGRELEVLKALKERLDDPGIRADELANVLVETIRISQAKGDDLAGAIEQPVQACIKQSIERDTQFFADALFPVMGPAIRRSITEALKGLVQSINASIDNTFSPQALRWRLEARRNGVSYGEVVLKHTLVYRVEQVLLVQRDTGLLMQHAERPDIVSKDGDAVSAMLTAIQDFVRDSFSAEGEQAGDLASVDVGEQTVWLIQSSKITMACVIRGIAPMSLRSDLQDVLEAMLRHHGAVIDTFEGDQSDLDVLTPYLEQCFDFVQNKKIGQTVVEGEFQEVPEDAQSVSTEEKTQSWIKRPATYVVVGVALLFVYCWFVWVHYHEDQRKNALLQHFENVSGVLVTASDYQKQYWYRPERKLNLRGLMDPEFDNADRLVAAVYENPEQSVALHFKPYHSLAPTLVLERIRRYLAAPDSVQLQLHGQQLVVSGAVRAAWYQRWYGQPLLIAGVSSVDWSDLSMDLSQEQTAFDQLLRGLNGVEFHFARRDQVQSELQQQIKQVAKQLKALQQVSSDLNRVLQVELVAYSDQLGDYEVNRRVRKQRAQMIKDLLIVEGVFTQSINIHDGGALGSKDTLDLQARKVMMTITTGEQVQ